MEVGIVLSQSVLNSFVVIFLLMNSTFSSSQFNPILIIRNYDTEKETSFIFSPCVGGLKLTKPSESGKTTSCILDSIKIGGAFNMQYVLIETLADKLEPLCLHSLRLSRREETNEIV